MALLQPGRCCSRRQGGCLQHRTEAQRRPKGQDAGGTPALPGDAVPAVPWGVSGGRLLRKPTCTLWETPVCPRVRRSPCRADHSSKNGRSLMKMNHEWTRRQMDLLQPQAAPHCFCNFVPWVWRCHGMTASWERGRPARTMPGTASAISPTWINRERSHGSPSAWPLLFPPTGWLPAASH